MADGTSIATPAPPRRGQAVGWLITVASLYLLALWYLDRDKHVLSRLGELAGPLAICAVLVLTSYIFRYQRWHALLRTQGHPVASWRWGFLAYLAGFAFTASPGKAGELLRIRYFSRQGVPSRVTLTTFVYERGLDLVVITLIGAGAAALVPLFAVLLGIVLAVVLGLYLVSAWPHLQTFARALILQLPGKRLRQLCTFMLDGVSALRPLLRPGLTITSTSQGAAAWLLTAAAFAWLCHCLGIVLPWQYAMAIYPLAMLVGALSFVPGGVGTTEAAIVMMLTSTGAGLQEALAAAIGIRLASLWLAVLVGMLALAGLEARTTR